MPTWPMGSGHDKDVRRSENEGFGQEAEPHRPEEQQHDVRDTDLQDADGQDRYPQNQDVPVASSPVETAEDYPAQETPVQDTRVDGTPVEDTPMQDSPVMSRPSEEGQSLLEAGFTDTFQQRWREIQTNFVDDPHETVRAADQLADEVVNTLTTALTDRKHSLDERWQAEKENTEELRLAMRGYRELLDRLIRL